MTARKPIRPATHSVATTGSFMSEARRLNAVIAAYLAPLLRADGFKGSGRRFRRIFPDHVEIFSVQGSRYGTAFAINLGIQPLSIPDASENMPIARTITEDKCEFRRRLSESGTDQWWPYYASEDSMRIAVLAAAAVYSRVGQRMFEQFAGTDSPLHTITAEALESSSDGLHGFGSTRFRTALALSRLRYVQNRPSEAKCFAQLALKHIGGAAGYRRELEIALA